MEAYYDDVSKIPTRLSQGRMGWMDSKELLTSTFQLTRLVWRLGKWLNMHLTESRLQAELMYYLTMALASERGNVA